MSTIQIHVGGNFADSKRRVLDAVARAKRGEAVGETHITFQSWAQLTEVLSGKRVELLRHLHRAPAVSVAALARALGRDYRRVHDDVAILTAAGLVERNDAGLRADYDSIQTTIALDGRGGRAARKR